MSNQLGVDQPTWRRLCAVILGAVVSVLEAERIDTIRTADLRAVAEGLKGGRA